ncbi:unnamed protein product [Kuraishia capsulata CBS 1993]|uniref:U three protein 7 n=1 Tax=Kuraishia capsulata CBS 1993 TaxID=1382522 RepID=W6MHB3_9ASCO|nr:uncharacterized protein KUCA_T00001579001 [Kuraishia capsulata CBS 1993]CDK25609.1 unnamed protein product [Kuraishia capsulata CBS 1993]
MAKPIHGNNVVPRKTEEKYKRMTSQAPVTTTDKKLRGSLKRLNEQHDDAVRSAAGTDILLQEEVGFLEAEGMEKTYKFKQDDIKGAVDVSTATKGLDLRLPELGPYTLDYSRNGRELLIGGTKGHVASMDWRTGVLDCELHLGETVRAVKYLHNDQYFAVAQKKYTFIYDKTGAELHRLKQHIEATNLDFLPYHFLLVSSGATGFLKYHDVSTGTLVSELRTKLGPTQCMAQNPWNAVMHLGHGNGQVTLWAPNMSSSLVKIQACKGPIRSVAVNRDGRYMVVAGADKTVKVWDVRTFREVESYYTLTPASSVDISDTGLVSVGWSSHVTVWKDLLKTRQKSPYMNELLPSCPVETTQFVPFEDILGVGHRNGVTNLIIPGAGEANYDALEVNPFETAKQRQQSEVRSLINKLSPDMISLDPDFIGTVDKRANQQRLTPAQLSQITLSKKEKEAAEAKEEVRPDVKSKNSALRRHKRKMRQNVIHERSTRVDAALKKEKELRKKKLDRARGVPEEKDLLGPALSRFV